MPEEDEEEVDDEEEEQEEDEEDDEEEEQDEESDEEDEDEEHEQEEEWSEARSIFGKLVGIDKKRQNLSIEYRLPNGEWQTETFSTKDFTDDEYTGLRRSLGNDITVNVVDDAVDSWEASR
jgi:hypothetical protein